MNKVIILSAPSGSGKTTIARKLLASDLGLEFSISACSREKRPGEIDGQDYFFLSPDEFRDRIQNDEFFEWEEVYKDHYYGTLKSEVHRIWDAGHTVLFDVDVVGGLNIKKILNDQALALFIQPPDLESLKARLIGRSSDSEEKIAMRLNKAAEELTFASKFDRIIINDRLQMAINETIDVVKDFLNKE